MDLVALKAGLEKLGVPQWRYLPATHSTNDDAIAWVASGAPDGALVIADQQTGGRGRMGRSWVTVAGAALAFSLVIRPTPAEMEKVSWFSPLGALGVSLALETLGLAPQIKWPNDVLLKRRKVCGILAEAVWTGAQLDALVLGIGVNIASQSVPADDAVIFPATSVQDVAGKPVDRLTVLIETLRAVSRWRQEMGGERFLEEWRRRLAFRGEMVKITPPNQPVLYGELVGIAENGSLLLRDDAGKTIEIMAGDVHLRLKFD